jgi:hypothetical protein
MYLRGCREVELESNSVTPHSVCVCVSLCLTVRDWFVGSPQADTRMLQLWEDYSAKPILAKPMLSTIRVSAYISSE